MTYLDESPDPGIQARKPRATAAVGDWACHEEGLAGSMQRLRQLDENGLRRFWGAVLGLSHSTRMLTCCTV